MPRQTLPRLACDRVAGVPWTRGYASAHGPLATRGIADWIRSYLHLLRVLGNESAHQKRRETRTPVSVDERDLALCMFCLLRVLEFYGETVALQRQ